jgi:trimeric autotransporter adhesin
MNGLMFHRVLRAPIRVALLCTLVWQNAQALTFCVNSVATLKSALSAAALNTQTPFLLKIVQGNYVMDADLITDFANPATIEGGYTAGCVARVVDPANTVIDIGIGHGVAWSQTVASPEAQLNVDGLTFSHTDSAPFFEAGSLGHNDDGSINISNTRFTGVASVKLAARGNSIRLENVLLDHLNTSFCSLDITAVNGATTTVNHMTADFTGSNGNVCLYDGIGSQHDAANFSFSNSIVWKVGGITQFAGGSLQFGIVSIANSIFSTTAIVGANVIIDNQINAAPGWIDPSVGNYRLAAASPAINSGTRFPPGGEPAADIEGTSRVIGSTPDRGAYESLVTDFSAITVTNNLDAGPGSLREAITIANQSISPPKLIQFAISGACPQVIGLNTVLPNIDGRMTIDGTSQTGSINNTSANGFNAKLCVLIKPAAGTLATGFTVPANSFGSLTLRGVGLGGFGQAVRLLGGQSNVVSGNQIGGTQSGVALPSAGLNAISVGSSSSGQFLIGGINLADRNFINGAGTSGLDTAFMATTSFSTCQIVNNVITNNNFGINNTGAGCQIVGNYLYGNSITNLWLNGSSNNIVQRNIIGPNFSNQTVTGNSVVGILLSGTANGNVIGAGGQGGIYGANTLRFNNGGGVIVRGDSAVNNSIKANFIYDNGAAANSMDIDLSPTGAASVGVGIAALTANDVGDGDSGPNNIQNFPVPTSMGYTGNGNGANQLDRPGIVTLTLDSQPGTHRIDVYYSTSANQLGLQGRGHAEIYLGHQDVFALFAAPLTFTVPVVIPTQLASGVVSFTATDSMGNTSEIGTGISINQPLIDDILKNGFE